MPCCPALRVAGARLEMNTYWARRGASDSFTLLMRQQLADALAKELDDVYASEVVVTVVPSSPMLVRAEACLTDAAATDAAVAALRKAFATSESAMALFGASGLNIVLRENEPPSVSAIMRGPSGEELAGADGSLASNAVPASLEALTAALRRRTGAMAAKAGETAKNLAEQAAHARRAAELARVAAAKAATLDAARAARAAEEEAKSKAKAAAIASQREAEVAEATARSLDSKPARRKSSSSLLSWFFGSNTKAIAQSSAPEPHLPSATERDASVDEVPTLDRIAALEADGADRATIEAERAKLQTEMAEWMQDAAAFRLSREAEAVAAAGAASRGWWGEMVYREKMREREEAERKFYTGSFEQARLERIAKAGRAKLIAGEMQNVKARAEAEAKLAEESADMGVDEEEAERRAIQALADAARTTAGAEAKLAADLDALIAAEEAAQEAAAQANAASIAAELALQELERELRAWSTA